jgi:hypothetical protein
MASDAVKPVFAQNRSSLGIFSDEIPEGHIFADCL